MKRGKRYQEAAKLRDKTNLYDAPEAVAIVKKAASAKFDETIEAHFKMGLDGRHADQQIRGAVVLPNGTGKKVRVLVFTKGDKVEAAKAAGPAVHHSAGKSDRRSGGPGLQQREAGGETDGGFLRRLCRDLHQGQPAFCQPGRPVLLLHPLLLCLETLPYPQTLLCIPPLSSVC